MKTVTDVYKLINGVEIPCVGFGTWQTPDGETAVMAVSEAIKSGYRHIDTASIYGNEGSVGIALAGCNVPREELFITTKVWADARGYDETIAAFNESLKKLQLDYLDLYLIHWPNPKAYRDCWKQKNTETWRAMEDLYKAGKIRSIGVSNFMPHHLEALFETAEIKPMVNQIRIHPGYVLDETIEFCKEHKILLEAYSPLGTGKLLEVPELVDVACKYEKSVAQVCLCWSIQMGFLPLPKSVTPSRIVENTEIFDFELTADEMKLLSSIDVGVNYCSPDEKDY